MVFLTLLEYPPLSQKGKFPLYLYHSCSLGNSEPPLNSPAELILGREIASHQRRDGFISAAGTARPAAAASIPWEKPSPTLL